MEIINRLLNSVVFWAAWIIIPVIMEIGPSVASVLILIKRHIDKKKNYKKPKVYPEISLIVPVYNSESTLFGCIKSIYDCDYPNDRIRVFLVNNKGKDDSFSVYAKCQKEFTDLPMQWLNSQQGKSKALNLALYNSSGKYIMNLDSDGMLEKSALTNMVDKFEANPDLNCMTGAILTMPHMIEEYKGFFPKLLRQLEFMEYAQAFLAGKSYSSETNSIYTLSGAFSAFRKSVVLRSQLYNTDTICEDTQITFQMKNFYHERVEVCEDAIYFVDPIEGVNKLYTQRQRWQRGSLEVAKMFSAKKFNLTRYFKDINIKTLAYDHTFAFPRMIWYLALACLLCMGYSGRAIIISTIMIFAMYIIIGYFYFLSNYFFLKEMPELQKYYTKQWWVVMLLPFYNTGLFFIRFAGIINSINTDSAWKTRDFRDENNAFWDEIKKDAKKLLKKIAKLRGFVNDFENDVEAKKVTSEEVSADEQKLSESAEAVNADTVSMDTVKASENVEAVSVDTVKASESTETANSGAEIENESSEAVSTETVKLSESPDKGKVDTGEKEKADNYIEKKSIGWYICVSIVYFLAVFVFAICAWVNDAYAVGLNELISTLSLKLKGTNSDVVVDALKFCLPPLIIAIVVIVLFIVIDRAKFTNKTGKVKRYLHEIIAYGAVISLFASLFYVNESYDIVSYFKNSVAKSQLYDDYYVNPKDVEITCKGNKKNLIYIYIESLETTYASTEDGGRQVVNYIPYLTKLTKENISFSNTDKLGGFHSTNGTGITMGALFGTTSGAAYNLGVEANEMLANGNFLNGIVSLGDILEENGYSQEFLCGSDGEFGGRKTYFEQHGNYRVYDLFTAREEGYIEDDYFVWWGFEDKILYEIAKDEVKRMASGSEPFNFTMLTVDPHHMDGYVCDSCRDDFESVTANVMNCTDTLLSDFIEWCKKQDFYKDTVIVVTGDHPRMDTSLVEGVSYYDRTIYNCFINTGKTGEYNTTNRVFTPMDIFPTVLSALGYEIEGDKLGLGTNLFSDKQTLAELRGFNWLDTELSKESEYYMREFMTE